MRMRALGATAVAAVVAGSIAVAAASAQELPETKASATVKATKVKGTKGLTLSGTAKVETEPGSEPPIVTGLDLLVGRGIVFKGGEYVTCSKRLLDRKGPSGCPKRSIMGAATATARADTVITHPEIVVVNAGQRRIYLYTTLYRPSLVKETIVMKTIPLKKGPWAFSDTVRVPENLQIVAGVPIQITGMRMKVGGKPYAKEWISYSSCPKGGFRYRATVYYLYDLLGQTDEDIVEGTVPCPR